MRGASGPVAVRLRDVGFSYPGKRGVLDRLDWEIRAGERVAVVANSGGGKTTLLNVLYGLREPSHGIVEIDGMDVRDIRRDTLRTGVALVRDPEVFSGTILENLLLDAPDGSVAAAKAALAAVGLLEEVQALPEGLNTELSPDGLPLSAGQAIRLRFARALLAEPRLLIADESLDMVKDARERDHLLDTLFRRDAPWTLVVATAEEEVLKRCDRVYEIVDGRLALTGARRG
jgi:ABC-type multidrug transport system fused ATPase/permease subunit